MTTNGHRPLAWGVASPHSAASEAAGAVLATGGSAVDAAIAAAGILTVVYPHNCSLGGDVIALVRSCGERPKAVFGVGRSATAIDVEGLRQRFGERVPTYGPFSISVPGVVSGWQAMHQLGGRLPLAQLLEPARRVAADGFPVTPSLDRALRALDSPDPGLAAVFGPPGHRAGTGDIVTQPRLAETIAQVGADPESYYRGALARQLAAGLAEAGSPIRVEDFASQHAAVNDAVQTAAPPLAASLFTAGLPSQGLFFAALADIAARLLSQGYELTGRHAAVLARTFSQISSLRDQLLSDPSRSPGPDHISARLAEIDATASDGAGGAERLVGEKTGAPSGDTVAVVTYDETGNSVSMLQSVFHSFGSRVLDPASGVLFHNRQSMFTLRPGAPGELGPGLMPPHTLCPVMIDGADGRPSIVLSTMGGRAQPQVLAQVLLQLASGKDATDAVSAPRFVVGDTETPSEHCTVTAEQGLPVDAVTSLTQGGFDVDIVAGRTEEAGHAQILRIGSDGVADAATDPRADGLAARAC